MEHFSHVKIDTYLFAWFLMTASEGVGWEGRNSYLRGQFSFCQSWSFMSFLDWFGCSGPIENWLETNKAVSYYLNSNSHALGGTDCVYSYVISTLDIVLCVYYWDIEILETLKDFRANSWFLSLEFDRSFVITFGGSRISPCGTALFVNSSIRTRQIGEKGE